MRRILMVLAGGFLLSGLAWGAGGLGGQDPSSGSGAVYRFEEQTRWTYQVGVTFDGFLPILGGNEGKAEVVMGVRVEGLAPEGELLRASNEMNSFEIKFNGARLPLTLDMARDFFPKTTVKLTPLGRIVSTDAPDIALPVRLPGLDVKRFPDITYLPLELPGGLLVVGSEWEFRKAFGDSDLVYRCRVEAVSGEFVLVSTRVRQEFEVWENDALEVVTDEKDAVARVRTVLTGTGSVVFDLNRGAAVRVSMSNDSVSTVTDLKSQNSTERRLASALDVKMVDSSGAAVPVPDFGGNGGRSGGVQGEPDGETGFLGWARSTWSSVVRTGREWWTAGAGWVLMARVALQWFLGGMPGGGAFGRMLGR